MSRHADLAGRVLWGLAALLALGQALEPQSAWSHWDAWAVWDFKARALLEFHGRIGAWLRDPGYAFTHPEYPLAWPAMLAVPGWLAGGFDPRWARLVSVPFAIALPPLLAGLLADLGVRRGRWLIAGAVACLPRVLEQSANGYADWPLAVVETAALRLVVRAVRGDAPGILPACGAALLAGLAANLKNEGLVFAVAILAVLALAVRRGAVRVAAAAGAVLVFLLFALPWRVYADRHGLHAGDFGLPVARVVQELPGRLTTVVGAVGLEAFGAGPAAGPAGAHGWVDHQAASWAGAWFLAAWVLLTGWRRLAGPAVGAVALVLAAQVAAAVGAYCVTVRDVGWLLASSLDRLMLQWVPAVAALAAVAAAGGRMKGRESR